MKTIKFSDFAAAEIVAILRSRIDFIKDNHFLDIPQLSDVYKEEIHRIEYYINEFKNGYNS